MRKAITLSGVLSALMLSSCSYVYTDFPEETTQYGFMSDKAIESNYFQQDNPKFGVAYELLSSYIELKESQYHVNISKAEAVCLLDISEKNYDEIVKAVESANIILDEIEDCYMKKGYSVNILDGISNGSMVASKPDPNYIYVEGDPTGELYTNGLETASRSFFAPNGVTAIKALCYSHVAPVPTHIVEVKALGSPIVATSIYNSRYMYIRLDASNLYCYISYRTSDSYGGICSWKAMRDNPNKHN